MARKNIKPTTLSQKVGNNMSLVKDLLEKTNDTKVSTLFKLADALDVSVADLLLQEVDVAPVGPQVFVKGRVAAGDWVEAFEYPRDEWRALTGRADVQADIEHRFFLEVIGDSMDLVYPAGTLIECVSVFGRAEVAPGKKVIVVRRRADDGLVEATVKEYVEIGGQPWLFPRSSNPAHQAFRADEPGDGIAQVRIAAVVVSSIRPE